MKGCRGLHKRPLVYYLVPQIIFTRKRGSIIYIFIFTLQTYVTHTTTYYLLKILKNKKGWYSMLLDAVMLWILYEISAPTWTYILVAVDIILRILNELIDI